MSPARCKHSNELGGAANPIDKCSPAPGAKGQCVVMRFPDPTYCSGYRHELRYDPTPEETEGYDSRTWIWEIGDILFDTLFGVFNQARWLKWESMLTPNTSTPLAWKSA